MPKKTVKVKVKTPPVVPTPPVAPAPVDTTPLKARQVYFLELMEQLKAEGIPVPSQLEVKLAQINKELGQ